MPGLPRVFVLSRKTFVLETTYSTFLSHPERRPLVLELNIEKLQRRNSQNARFLGWYKLTVSALPQRDRDLYTGVSKTWTTYVILKVLRFVARVVFQCSTMFFKDGTDFENRFVGRIAKAEFFLLLLGAFFRRTKREVVHSLSFVRCD